MRWLPRGQAPLRWAVRRLTGRGTPAEQVAAWRVVREAQLDDVRTAFDEAADRAHARDGLAVQRLRRNLGRVASEEDVEDVVAGALRTAHRAWAEGLLGHLGEVRVEGVAVLETAARAGHGVLLAVPHQAGPDRAALWLGRRLGGLVDLTAPLRPTRLTEALRRERSAYGVDRRPERPDDLDRLELERELGQGGVVLVGGDHDEDHTTVVVRLLGEEADLPVRPATLATVTGAALLPLTLRYDGPALVLRVHDPVPRDVPVRMTQALADAYGQAVATDPSGWYLDHLVFTLDRQAHL